VWSKPGTGSTFTLSIPAYRDGDDELEQPRGRDVRPGRSQREEELSR
jgi:two-component system, OmpR family, sensor histidine kinase SenX3